MATLFIPSLTRAVDNNGNPAAGAKMFFYASGTTTAKTYYLDDEETVPGPFPLVADAYGTFPVAFITGDGEYRVRVTDATESQVFYDVDPVTSTGAASGGNVIVPNGISTLAVQEAIDLANSGIGASKIVQFDSRYQYILTDTIRVGNDNATSNVRILDFNGAQIVPGVSGKPLFDLVGIRNGLLQVKNLHYNTQGTTFVPECLFSLGRPKQASGVKSSGNIIFSGNAVFGNFSVAIVRNASSEANFFDKTNRFFNYNQIGICIAITKSDYFLDTAVIEYDGKTGAAFLPGSTLTGANGGTAKILHTVQTWTATTGAAFVHITSGDFVDNELLTGSAGGTALVNMANGVYKNKALSTLPALGLEVGTTAALQMIECYCNAASTKAVMPPLFISDFTDVDCSNGMYNVNNGQLAMIHVQQDLTRFPSNSQPPVGFRCVNNYMHSDHKYSITIGDPASGTVGAEAENWEMGPQKNAGSPTAMSGRIKYLGAAGYPMRDVRICSDHDVDLRGVVLKYNNVINLVDQNYSGTQLDQLCSARINAFTGCASRILLTMSNNANNVSTYWTDLGTTTLPPLDSVRNISSGAITINRPVFRVETEGAAASDDLEAINLPASVPASGMVISFRSTNNLRVVTVKANARIIGLADVVLDNINKTITLVGESGAGSTAVFRMASVV